MGVREPGFRILTYEMSVKEREEKYRGGGLFSVTSKILVNDLLSEPKQTCGADGQRAMCLLT